MTGPDKLKAWMTTTGRKPTWVASQVGVDYKTLHAWTKGRHAPNPAAADRLEALTDGAIKVGDWG